MLNYTKQIKYPITNSWLWSGSTSVDCHDSKEKNYFILNTIMLFKQHIGWPIPDHDLKNFTYLFLKMRFMPCPVKWMFKLQWGERSFPSALDDVSRETHRGLEWHTCVIPGLTPVLTAWPCPTKDVQGTPQQTQTVPQQGREWLTCMSVSGSARI